MAERQTRDLEVRIRISVQVQMFLLKFMKNNIYNNNDYYAVSLQHIGGLCLPTDCWPQEQEVKDHRVSLGTTCCQHLEFISFLNHFIINHLIKLVVRASDCL